MKFKLLISFFLSCTFAISCSKVKFANAPTAACEAADSCVQTGDGTTYTQNLIPAAPNNKVDILIVDDNSISMRQRHANLAARFPQFLQSIANVDYRIAIVTTDNTALDTTDPQINSLPQYLKDHKNAAMVPFLGNNHANSGLYFIDRSTPNVQTLFTNTIQRPESIYCAQHPEQLQMCLKLISGDERGIYSAIRNVQANSHGFLRPDARLHVIVISDEDERSNGGGYPGMTIVDGQDRPQDLTAASPNVMVHSIVNLPVGYGNGANFDFNSCVTGQIYNLNTDNYNGCFYIQTSNLTHGSVADIDVNDYQPALAQIASSIQSTSITQFSFNCVPDIVSLSHVDGYPMPQGYHEGPVSGVPSSTIYFNPPITFGTALAVTWHCPRN